MLEIKNTASKMKNDFDKFLAKERVPEIENMSVVLPELKRKQKKKKNNKRKRKTEWNVQKL